MSSFRCRWYLVSLPLVFLAARALPAQTVVPDTLASRHVGEVITVEGTVHDVHISKRHGITYLNFGGAYPDITFAVHVPDSVGSRIPELPRLAGRRTRVTGQIWLQDDRWPAITVTDPAQVRPVE